MASVVALNASPEGVLRSLRGLITAARRAYPDVLHVEIQDPNGGLWKLSTQDADWSPADPSQLMDHRVEAADLDGKTGELRLVLNGGSIFKVAPAEQEADDDPPNWKLFTPEGLVLVFGPGGKWRFNRADEPVGPSLAQEADSRLRNDRESDALVLTLAKRVLAHQEDERASEVLLKERTLSHEPLFLVLAVGLSILSIAVAAISLAIALQ